MNLPTEIFLVYATIPEFRDARPYDFQLTQRELAPHGFTYTLDAAKAYVNAWMAQRLQARGDTTSFITEWGDESGSEGPWLYQMRGPTLNALVPVLEAAYIQRIRLLDTEDSAE